MSVSVIKADGTESTWPRCMVSLDGRDLIVRTLEGDLVANYGLKWRSAQDGTKLLTNASPAPSWMEHRAAQMRGIYLCDDCGAELAYPANPQLCGTCEQLYEDAR